MVKRLLILVSVITFVFLASNAQSSTSFYGAIALTGGTTGSLDNIDGTSLATGDVCYTITSTAFYVHYLNATSGAGESSPDIISPDANAGNKRWILIFQGDPVTAEIAQLAVTNGNIIVGNDTTWVAESGATARTSLGLGTGDAVTHTALDVGASTLATRSLTVDTGGGFDINLGTAAGDDFTVDTSAFVVNGDTGNVGIGTASPSAAAKLHVVNDGPLSIYEENTAAANVNNGVTHGTRLKTSVKSRDVYYNHVTLSDITDATRTTKVDFLLMDSGSLVSTLTMNGGKVGIDTTAPGNPLAVNRSADGVIVDFESADTVEGNISIAVNTTSYNAFVGSHYTQLGAGQEELPVGAVVISTGKIIPCSVSKQKFTKVLETEAITIIQKADAVELKDLEVEDKDNVISQEATYTYDPDTDTEKPTTIYTYGIKTIKKTRLKEGAYFHEKTRQFYTIKPGHIKRDDGFYIEQTVVKLKPGKEYFVYVDTTTTAADTRVYGVWLAKMADDARGMSFGKDSDPVYLIAQVGLFKIRVTDTNGNIANGDYLETSTRAMEAQKQTSTQKLNSTIAKSMIDVDWGTVAVDPGLGYKWRLVPCTF